MSKVTIRNLIIAGIFLVFSLGLFGYGLIVIDRQNTQLIAQVTALATNQAQEESLRQMQRTADESEDNRNILDSSFLSEEGDSIDYLNRVETLARASGLAITTNELSKDNATGGKDEILTVAFTLDGEYEVLTNFLQVLENLNYVAELRSVELRRNTALASWQARVSTQVYLYSYEN